MDDIQPIAFDEAWRRLTTDGRIFGPNGFDYCTPAFDRMTKGAAEATKTFAALGAAFGKVNLDFVDHSDMLLLEKERSRLELLEHPEGGTW